MQTNTAVEQSKIIRWSDRPWNQSARKGKGLPIHPNAKKQSTFSLHAHFPSVIGSGEECSFYMYMPLKLLTPLNVTDFQPIYMPTSTTVLSDNPAVALPLLTINRWIVMMSKVNGSSVTFMQTWESYRDGFGSPTGHDNYWLGLEKVYRLQQLGNVRLRIEVIFSLLERLRSTGEPSGKQPLRQPTTTT